jgi:hypothetical protein
MNQLWRGGVVPREKKPQADYLQMFRRVVIGQRECGGGPPKQPQASHLSRQCTLANVLRGECDETQATPGVYWPLARVPFYSFGWVRGLQLLAT